MTELELIEEIKDALSHSCSLPYNLKEPEMKRIIRLARKWMYDNYQYAVEERVFVLSSSLFNHPEFIKTRQIVLPEKIVTVHEVREVNGTGISGNPDKDFGDAKLLGSELLMSPFIGDNLVYRTVMYSYFDLARAYMLDTYAFKWNKNSKKLTILGRDPYRSGPGGGESPQSNKGMLDSGGINLAIKCFAAIDDDELYDDELFIRYCIAKSKISLARMLSAFTYNLPGGVQVNTADLKADGDSELQEVMDMINDENTPSYFLQWN